MSTIGQLRENLRVGASPLSVFCFWWLRDLFVTGTKRELTLTDLYAPLPEDRSAVVTSRLEKNWLRELKENSANPSLVRVILKTFWREFFLAGLVTVFNDFVVRLINPLLLQTVLRFFRRDSEVEFSEVCYSAAGIVLLGLCGVFSYNQITYIGCHNGGKIRTAVCGLVYRKTLRLSKMSNTEREKSSGHVLNLMSNDVARFEMVAVFVHWVWSAPLLILVIAWILYERMGWPPLIGVGIILIVVPLQCYLGMLSSKIQLRTAIQTDERLGLVSELIAGIKMIKMYAWEKWIGTRIVGVREKELRMIRLSGFIRGIYMAMSLFVTRLMITGTLAALCFASATTTLTTANVFMIAAYYNVIGHAVGQMFVRGVTELLAANVSIGRLEDYLKTNESAAKYKDTQRSKSSPTKPAVQIQAATAYWKRQIRLIETKTMLLYKDPLPTLNNINVHIPDNLLVGIVGAVGSGKSSLLEMIMGELTTDNRGEVTVNGGISYSPQESWIFHGSIRENITYNEPWNESRYQSVLEKCNLMEDFKAMPAGDETVIGERGTVLSGGQRARVSLARAIYRRADIYLLDDPLSAVDSQVGRYLFDDIISGSGFLKNSTRLLVTHQLEYLKYVDWILVMNNGSIEVQGRPDEILGTELQLNKYESKTTTTRRDSIEENHSNACDAENMQQLENVVVPQKSVILKYLRYGGRTWSLVLICVLFGLTQFACSSFDAFVAQWIRFENTPTSVNATESLATKSSFKESKPLILMSCLLLVAIICLGVLRTYVFQCFTVRKSSEIHKEMLRGVLETPIRFFDTNPSGRILNKFSRDLGVMDVLLPKVILDALQMVLIICGALAVVVLVNPWFLIPIVVLLMAFRAARRVYIKSSKHLKRLDGITRSPIFTHVNSTMSGLSVIRSTKAEQRMIRQFDAIQDLHTTTWFLFLSTTTAFCQVLDLLAVIFIAIVLVYFLLYPSVIAEEKIGLAISQAMMISGLLSWGVRQSAAVSNAFVSVERILDLVMLPKEVQTEGTQSKESVNCEFVNLGNWPRTGTVEFSNVNLRYGEQTVLHDVNLLIKDGQKVGVVGRTGAGKSSLISAMFRLSEFDGAIMIDGVDTRTIPLVILRRRISIIPQDPVLFRGTVKSNLDPFHEFSEHDIGLALADVDMSHISLKLPVQENGNNFSVGQKQLLCLARAILRKNRILILDEATANVDFNTDEMIQKTIRKRLRDCTVISIAHRLNTVEDADLIVRIDRGRICDVGPPISCVKSWAEL